MNKSYRSIWNESLGAWVAVAEIFSARGKPGGTVLGSSTSAMRKRFRLAAMSGAAFAACLGFVSLPAAAGYGVFINDGTDNGCVWTFDMQGLSSIGRYAGSTAPGAADSAANGGLPTNAQLGTAGTRCVTTDKSTQINRALFYGASGGAGANSLSIGGELFVNSGNLGLGAGTETNAMRIGSTATLGAVSGNRALAIGAGTNPTNAAGEDAIAIGTSANALSSGSVAVGLLSSASGANTIAVGAGTRANGSGATAIGNNAKAAFVNDIAFGTMALAVGDSVGETPSTAFGNNAKATGLGSTAFGSLATATGPRSAAIGNGAFTGAESATAIGAGGAATKNYATAIGSYSLADGVSSTAMGDSANALGDSSVALGASAKASYGNSVAIGAGSTTGTAAPTGAAFLTGKAAPASEVSVGSSSALRRITNVADGAAQQDAVTVAQLSTGMSTTASSIGSLSTSTSSGLSTATSRINSLSTSTSTGLSTATSGIGSLSTGLSSANSSIGSLSTGLSNSVRYDDASHTKVTLGGAGSTTPVILTNVAAGAISPTSTDAVNGSQLNAVVTGVNKLGASVATALGGNATYDPATGNVAGFSVPISSVDANGKVVAAPAQTTVGGALGALNTNVGNLAGSAVQYDADSGKGSATLGGAASSDGGKTGGTRLSNVAQGALGPTSTDAVNGSQLNTTNANASTFLGGGADVAKGTAPTYAVAGGSFNDVGSALDAVDKVASKGWNLSANGAAAQKIAPGDTVEFVNGSNTTVSRAGNQIKVDVSKTPTFDSVTVGPGTPGAGSATLGANGLTTIGTDGKAGPSMTTAGIDASGKPITNVGAGSNGTDAANMNQVKAVEAKADNAVQYDKNADGTPGKASITLGGLNADGTPATPVKLGNVADGNVAAGSKDAVNGGQLNAVSETANKGWNLSANGEASPQNIAPGGKVDFVDGSNTAVTRTGNQIRIDVSKTPTFESVTATNGTPGNPGASATLGADGLTTKGADGTAGPSMTAAGIDAGGKPLTNVGAGSKDTDAANMAQVKEAQAKADNAVQYDAKNGAPGKDSITLGGLGADGSPATSPVKLANVADGNMAAGSKDAVNGGQLNAVSETANKGWNLSVNGEASPRNIAPGGAVDFIDGSNTTVSRAGNRIRVDLSKTPVFDSVTVGSGVPGTPGTGSATLGANGLTTVGVDGKAGPSVTAAGIDAAGKPIANVGAGEKDTDAASVGQLKAMTASGGNSVQYDGGGRSAVTLGGLDADGTPSTAPVKLANVADGNVAAGSKDAVNGGQLNTTNQNITNLGNDIRTGAIGSVQAVPGKTDQLTLVAPGATGAAPGNAQVLGNVAAGTAPTDAVNRGQLDALAGSAVQYDKNADGTPGKDSITLGGLNADGTPVAPPVKLGNVADGSVAAGSKDAVNGGQLNAVSETANKGWNLSANGIAAQKIAPGDTVDFVDGSNTTVTRTNNQIKVDVSKTPTFDSVTVGTGAPGTGSATLGANGLTTKAADGAAGPSVTTAGIDAGGKPIANVGAGTNGTDAANVDQVKAVEAKADSAVQYDKNADGTPGKDGITLGGLNADGTPTTAPVKLGNVADGSVAAGSKDAVNGGQLNAVSETANKGWNLSANGADAFNVAPGGKVDFVNGSNTLVSRSGNQIMVDVSRTPVFESVTASNGTSGNPGASATLGANGLTTRGADGASGPSVTATGIDAAGKPIANVGAGEKDTDAASVGQLKAMTASGGNSVQYDGGGRSAVTLGGVDANGASTSAPVKLGNVADGNVATGSKDAVNGGQLNAVSETANKGWNLSANGAATQKIAPGDTVDFINGSNTTVSRAGNQIQVDVSKTPTFDSVTVGSGVAGTPGTGSATLGANGLTTVGTDGNAGPSVTTAGIDAGGKPITNVGAGTNGTDAANVNQVKAAEAKADNALQYDKNADGTPGKDGITLGGLGADGSPASAPVKLGNVADGNVAAGSKDAVNGGQLNAVSETANKGWNLSANGEGTPQKIAPGDTVDFINGSNTTVSRTGNQIQVDVSKTPVFDSVTVGSGVAGTPGTGSTTLGANGLTTIGTDGKAGPSVTSAGIDAGGKPLTNVGAGTKDTDAANMAQVKDAQAKAGNAVQYDPTADGKPGKDSITLGGLNADGTPATPVKLGNVADGNVAAGSKDAVNGGQLNTINDRTNTFLGGGADMASGKAPTYDVAGGSFNDVGSALGAVDRLAGKGWNLSANGEAAAQQIAPGATVDFIDGSNTTVSRSGNQIKVDVSKTPTFDSVTATSGTPGSASATLGANGLTTIGTDGKAGPSVTGAGIDAGGKPITNVGAGTNGTDAANVDQVNAVQAKADNAVQYDKNADGTPGKDSITLGGLDADGKPAAAPVKLGNVADGNVAAGSKDAINGGQLNTLGTGIGNVLGGSYTNGVYTPPTFVTVGGGTATTVQGALDNLGAAVAGGAVGPVQQTGKNGQLALVAPGATGAAPGAPQQLTNVKNGELSSTSSDAVNGSQLHAVGEAVAAVGAKADNALQYDKGADGAPGKSSITLGGTGADGKTPSTDPVKLGNVADGNVAAGSKDAVNGGQLFTTNQNVTNLGNDLKNLGANINDGKVGPLQRTGNADELVLVGKDATADSPGAAQRVTNVASGTKAGDAVNFGQLQEVASTANNSLQYDGADKRAATMGGAASTDGGKTGGTRLGNVAQGAVNDKSTDAVNGAQLNATNTAVSSALGGGANLNEGRAPSYTVQGNTYDNVGGALGSVNDNLSTVNSAINGGGIKYFRANSVLPDADASGTDAVAVGPQAVAGGAASVAVGSGAQAAPASGTAIGFKAVVQQMGGVALGAGSVASTASGVAGHVPEGAGAQQAAAVRATTGTQGAVSVGDAASGQFRQITGVAAGTADSDAANVAQLKASASAAKAGSVQYDTNADGTPNYGHITMGNGQAPDGTRISNVAPGVQGTDAVNVNQLGRATAAAMDYTDARVNQLGHALQDVAKKSYAGTAAAMAMETAPYIAGKVTYAAGMGHYQGQTAVGASLRKTAESGRWSVSGGVTATSAGTVGVRAGISGVWD